MLNMKIQGISQKIALGISNVCYSLGVFAVSDIKKGKTLVDIEAKITKKPTDYTLQIDESKFLIAEYIDNYINHSCNPNVFIRLYKNNEKRVSFIALKKIKAGQELFWNFNSTEWNLTTKFPCGCGSKNCILKVKGFKYISKKQRDKIKNITSPYLRKKVINPS